MKNDSYEAIADRNRRRAWQVVDELNLVKIWEAAGARVNSVGSLATGLLAKHLDIDFHIYSEPPLLPSGFAAMARIAEKTEESINYRKRFVSAEFKIKNTVDAISHATCGMAIDIGAKAIVVSSLSGRTVRMVSRFRVPTDIVGMATSKAVWYKLALSWGVQPVLCEHFESTDVLFYHARKAAKQALHLQPGDNIVLTGGTVNGTSGNTNLIRVDTII